MDVLDGRVHHAAGAARLGVERRLEKRAEDRGRDVAPVEVGGLDEQLPYFVIERRNLRIGNAAEKSAVGVGKRGKLWLEVGVALTFGRIERAEEFQELSTEKLRRCSVSCSTSDYTAVADFILRQPELPDEHVSAATGNYNLLQLQAACKGICFYYLWDTQELDGYQA